MRKTLLIILLASVATAQVITFFQKRIPTTSTLMTGLLEHWGLDETSGTRYGYFGHDLTDNNTVLYGAGKYNNGSDHEADNGAEYLSHADDDSLNFSSSESFTISYWIKLETISGYAPGLSKTSGPKFNQAEWDLSPGYGTTTNYEFTISDASVYANVISDSSKSTRWTCLVAWYNAGTDSIYIRVNNGQKKRAKANSKISARTNPMYIGYWNDSTYKLDSIIDLVSIWSRCPQASNGYAMSDSIYNSGNGWRPGL